MISDIIITPQFEHIPVLYFNNKANLMTRHFYVSIHRNFQNNLHD